MSNSIRYQCKQIIYVKIILLRCKCLHALPKFASNTQRIQVGNGQYVGVLFVISVIVDVHGHRFEIFTLISEIYENVDLVLGIKNIFELEGVIDSCDSCFSFLNRSIPFFPKEKTEVNPKEQKLVIVEAPFIEKISGMTNVKLLDMQEQVTNMIKLKFVRNRATLKVTNNTHDTVMFDLTEMMGILDLRSLGYYKIKQDVLHQNLSKHYHLESVDTMFKQFNRFVNLLKKEEGNTEENYLWLDKNDERKYMTDREILDTYINLDDSCLTKEEKKEVRDLLYEYKDTFSLRDEIGMCLNIEVGTDVMDKTPFFIRPFHAKEEDNIILDKR